MSATTRKTASRNRRNQAERTIAAPTRVVTDVDLQAWAAFQRAAAGAQTRARS